jgi:hypothetical protein
MRRSVLAVLLAFGLGAMSAVSIVAGVGEARWRVAVDLEPVTIEVSAEGVHLELDWLKERV